MLVYIVLTILDNGEANHEENVRRWETGCGCYGSSGSVMVMRCAGGWIVE